MTTVLPPECVYCVHFDALAWTCPAFPKGIPEDIAMGHVRHRRKYPGQVGDTVFERAGAVKGETPVRFTRKELGRLS